MSSISTRAPLLPVLVQTSYSIGQRLVSVCDSSLPRTSTLFVSFSFENATTIAATTVHFVLGATATTLSRSGEVIQRAHIHQVDAKRVRPAFIHRDAGFTRGSCLIRSRQSVSLLGRVSSLYCRT